MRYLVFFFLFLNSSYSKDLSANFLIFGDSGYHESYPKPEEGPDGITMDERKKIALEDGDVLNDKPVFPALSPNKLKKKYYFEKGGAFLVGKAMTNYCKKNTCDFSLMLGDNIYPNGAQGDESDEKRFRQLIYMPFKNLERNNKDFRFYVILGNHDWYSHEWIPDNPKRMEELAYKGIYAQMEYYSRPGSRYVLNPDSTDPKRKTYYNFTTNEGKIEFFALDTQKILNGLKVPDYKNPAKFEKNFTPTSKEELEEMITWLKEGLKNSNADWKIVFGHHPLYSLGGTKFMQAKLLRELLLDTLCKYADIYMAGHEHDMEYHVASCQGLPDLELLVSGAASKQRSVGITPPSKKLIFDQNREYQFGKGLIWGFAHMTIKDNLAEVNLFEVDDGGDYKPIFKKGILNRSKFIPKN